MRASCRSIRSTPTRPVRWRAPCWARPASSPGREALVEAVVRESAGNPFFVAELVRHVQSDDVVAGTDWSSPDPSSFQEASASPSRSTTIALDDVLWARIRRLPEEARHVLEIIAVSGQPLGLEAISRCADLEQDERVSLALLRSGRLIRSTGRVGTRRDRDLSRPDPRNRRGPARAGGDARASSAAGADA